MGTDLHAFRMHFKPGNEAEYARRHAQLWPDSPVSVPLEQVFHLD